MSVTETAGQLISHASDYIQNAHGITVATGNSLGQAIANVAQLGQNTSESVAMVSALLGDGHASVGPIAGVAQSVHSKVADVQGAIQALVQMSDELYQIMTTYSSTVSAVGSVLLQGGGG
jgi:methyl-accepting chemotaxis protein